jgi:hypothetical protein
VTTGRRYQIAAALSRVLADLVARGVRCRGEVTRLGD